MSTTCCPHSVHLLDQSPLVWRLSFASWPSSVLLGAVLVCSLDSTFPFAFASRRQADNNNAARNCVTHTAGYGKGGGTPTFMGRSRPLDDMWREIPRSQQPSRRG